MYLGSRRVQDSFCRTLVEGFDVFLCHFVLVDPVARFAFCFQYPVGEH